MDRRIKVSDDLRRKIAKAFGVTETTVRNALRYDAKKGQTETAVKIRAMALQNGGVLSITLPECETIHDEGTGEMVQTFGNGAKLTINKNTGYAVVRYPNGDPHMGWKDVTVRQIPVLQEIAASL
ncbi:MAG: hypothetical protein IJS30_06800 [Bacteroidales bacterium]|nr:hypothetical protein [Bacteroidales bacterium]